MLSFTILPSLPLPHLPFRPVFPRLLFAQVELSSFPRILRCSSPGWVQGQEATGSAGTCPLPGHRGTGSDGWWSVGAESYEETAGVSWKSCLGTLFCFMVFRKCSPVEEQLLRIKDSGPAAECELWMPTSAVPLLQIATKQKQWLAQKLSLMGHLALGCVRLVLSPWSLHYLGCKEFWPCPDFVPTKRILQCVWNDHHVTLPGSMWAIFQTNIICKFANPIVPGKINFLQSVEVLQEAKLQTALQILNYVEVGEFSHFCSMWSNLAFSAP